MNRISFTLQLATAALMVTVYGCSAVDSDNDRPSSSVTSTGGSGGQQLVGGAGGSGGEATACPTDCSEVETNTCQTAICESDSGSCVIVDLEDGIFCDDGQFCTINDSCQAGVCMAGPPNDCGLTADSCAATACDELTKSCTQKPLADGSACEPDNKCMLGGECSDGVCVGELNECFFAPLPNDCHVAVCNPTSGECEAVVGNEGGSCTDPGDLCTEGKTCSAGSCSGGVPKNCKGLTQGCQLGVCDAATGLCQPQQLLNGDLCDDFNSCTMGEVCSAGSCLGGSSVQNCVDNDNCCPSGCTGANDSDCVLDILLMGDNVSENHWNVYRSSLQAAGASWTEHNLDNLSFPTAAQLSSYNTLIWFEETVVTSGDLESQRVADWLRLGNRHLFVTGVYMMWDFKNSTVGEGEHNLYQSWGTNLVNHGSGTGISSIQGIVGDPVAGAFAPPNALILSGNADSDGDYASAVVGPAIHGAVYGSGGLGSSSSALSHYDAGGYRVVWLGVNFHNGLTNAAQRNTLMFEVLDFLQ